MSSFGTSLTSVSLNAPYMHKKLSAVSSCNRMHFPDLFNMIDCIKAYALSPEKGSSPASISYNTTASFHSCHGERSY
jgi:hypothetical protein